MVFIPASFGVRTNTFKWIRVYTQTQSQKWCSDGESVGEFRVFESKVYLAKVFMSGHIWRCLIVWVNPSLNRSKKKVKTQKFTHTHIFKRASSNALSPTWQLVERVIDNLIIFKLSICARTDSFCAYINNSIIASSQYGYKIYVESFSKIV